MRVIFPDPQRVTLDVLREGLAEYAETADVSCGTLQVEDAADKGVTLPYVAVFLDNSDTRYPVTEDALLRLTCWAGSARSSLRILRVALAVLRDHYGDEARSYGDPANGPFASTDPDSGQPLATTTITARLKPGSL